MAPGHPPATQRGHSSGAQNAFCRPAASGPAPGLAVGVGRGGRVTGPLGPPGPAQASAGSSVLAPHPPRPEVQPAVHIRLHRRLPQLLWPHTLHAHCLLHGGCGHAGGPARPEHVETLLPMRGPGSLPPLPGMAGVPLPRLTRQQAQQQPPGVSCAPPPSGTRRPPLQSPPETKPTVGPGQEVRGSTPPHPTLPEKVHARRKPPRRGLSAEEGTPQQSHGPSVESRTLGSGVEGGTSLPTSPGLGVCEPTWCGFHDKDTNSLCGRLYLARSPPDGPAAAAAPPPQGPGFPASLLLAAPCSSGSGPGSTPGSPDGRWGVAGACPPAAGSQPGPVQGAGQANSAAAGGQP